MRLSFRGTVRKLAQRYWCALCPGARVQGTATERPALPRWLSTLHGFVTVVVLVLLLVAVVSFAAVVVLAACSAWECICDFLARFGMVQA